MNTGPFLVTPERLASLRKGGQHLSMVDVGTPAEYHAGHLEGAALVPLAEIDPHALRARIGRPGAGRYETLYLTCHDGARALRAADCLLQAGYYNLAVLDGGNRAWQEAGLPMVRTAPIPSLDRQVQIAAGTLLLIPVVLGFVIHELFFVPVPLIAAGLILAGAIGWSGMERMLARMPWNRAGRA
jgi:rhodanese-related sulfurtransferase